MAGKLDTAREHLVDARLALLDAELYLVVQDTARASIQMDLAQAYTSEARRVMVAVQPQPTLTNVHQMTGNPTIDRFLE